MKGKKKAKEVKLVEKATDKSQESSLVSKGKKLVFFSCASPTRDILDISEAGA